MDLLHSLRVEALGRLNIKRNPLTDFYEGGIHGVLTREEAFKKAEVVMNKWSNAQLVSVISRILQDHES